VEERPLAGFTVAVTAARRREELIALLQRRGARTIEAPALRIIPTTDDQQLLAMTRQCVADRPDVTLVTTGIGFRGWLEAAEGWGLADVLTARLTDSRIMTRGPKATGAVRAAGLVEEWSPDGESSEEMVGHLLAQGVRGLRVAVQLHGEPLTELCQALRDGGAEVLEIPVYRWVPADDMRPVRRLVEQIATGQVDCVTFTSAPAVASLLATAREEDRIAAMLDGFRGPVLAAAVGAVTAAPLERLGVRTVQPARSRLGALVRTVVETLPAHRSRTVRAGDHTLELRGHTVLVDGRPVPLTGRQVGVMAALVAGDGRVLSRTDLLRVAWPEQSRDEHAVEMTVARLRTALGAAGPLVETVVKRGYRLAAPTATSAVTTLPSQTSRDDVQER
jgi:uroporphyrinogen-III synthase